MKFEKCNIDDILASACPDGGDASNDCEGCVYGPEYHLVDGECILRTYEPEAQVYGAPEEVHR